MHKDETGYFFVTDGEVDSYIEGWGFKHLRIPELPEGDLMALCTITFRNGHAVTATQQFSVSDDPEAERANARALEFARIKAADCVCFHERENMLSPSTTEIAA